MYVSIEELMQRLLEYTMGGTGSYYGAHESPASRRFTDRYTYRYNKGVGDELKRGGTNDNNVQGKRMNSGVQGKRITAMYNESE